MKGLESGIYHSTQDCLYSSFGCGTPDWQHGVAGTLSGAAWCSHDREGNREKGVEREIGKQSRATDVGVWSTYVALSRHVFNVRQVKRTVFEFDVYTQYRFQNASSRNKANNVQV